MGSKIPLRTAEKTKKKQKKNKNDKNVKTKPYFRNSRCTCYQNRRYTTNTRPFLLSLFSTVFLLENRKRTNFALKLLNAQI
jgi:hypothetical protein